MHLTFPPACWALLREQSHVISRQQALGLGMTPTRLEALVDHGFLHRLVPGIYTTAAEPTWLARVWAGVLIGGPQSVVGGQAALALAGLMEQPDAITIWVGRGRSCVQRPGYQFVRGDRRGRVSRPEPGWKTPCWT